MEKGQKIDTMAGAMKLSTRRETDEEYTHFTDEAPDELKQVFFDFTSGSLRNVDYMIFSNAIDYIVEAWADLENADSESLQEYIAEHGGEFASIWYNVQLSYLNNENMQDISDTFKELECKNIADACAYWYDDQVLQAIQAILDGYLFATKE